MNPARGLLSVAIQYGFICSGLRGLFCPWHGWMITPPNMEREFDGIEREYQEAMNSPLSREYERKLSLTIPLFFNVMWNVEFQFISRPAEDGNVAKYLSLKYMPDTFPDRMSLVVALDNSGSVSWKNLVRRFEDTVHGMLPHIGGIRQQSNCTSPSHNYGSALIEQKFYEMGASEMASCNFTRKFLRECYPCYYKENQSLLEYFGVVHPKNR